MSSSNSTRTGARVLRGAASRAVAPTQLLHLDLATAGLARLDPRRVEEAVDQGRAAGFDAGFATGLDEAREQQAAITAAHRARLVGVVTAAEHAVEHALVQLADAAGTAASATASAAFAVAEAIVGRELATATDPGLDAVARALALTPDGVDVTLRLHPADARVLIDEELSAGRTLRVVPDPTLAPGDCVAEAGWTRVDARIHTALARVRAVLEETS